MQLPTSVITERHHTPIQIQTHTHKNSQHNGLKQKTQKQKIFKVVVYVHVHTTYTLSRSPAVRQTAVSDLRGLKWHTQWFRDRHVGNAMPTDRDEHEGSSLHVNVQYIPHGRFLCILFANIGKPMSLNYN